MDSRRPVKPRSAVSDESEIRQDWERIERNKRNCRYRKNCTLGVLVVYAFAFLYTIKDRLDKGIFKTWKVDLCHRLIGRASGFFFWATPSRTTTRSAEQWMHVLKPTVLTPTAETPAFLYAEKRMLFWRLASILLEWRNDSPRFYLVDQECLPMLQELARSIPEI